MKYILTLPPALVENFHQVAAKEANDWFVTADPAGHRVGSGGGTAHALIECWKTEGAGDWREWQGRDKRMVIHAGGQSRRLPAYAPVGKILTPLPIFRWSRGQDINQTLLDLQVPLYNKILRSSARSANTLITSGDVLILNDGRLPEIPTADVVCFGIWTEPAKATNHGVFFLERGSSGTLAFMLQKPTTDKIIELTNRYDQLIDIGVWLLSDKAVRLLMAKSGWDEQTNTFRNGIPDFYDLYSDFGLGLGANPAAVDPEISALTTAIVPLDAGEFYHFGKTNELIESAVALQNRVLNQRMIWHRKVKPNPAIFVLNSCAEVTLTPENHYLWIENSHLGPHWQLAQNHMITGVPPNNWALTLTNGTCLDIVPVGHGDYCIRPYGYTDNFKGDVHRATTRWLGQPCSAWFTKRDIPWPGFFADDTDIQEAPLFPVIAAADLDESFIQWLVDPDPAANAEARDRYLKAPKLSASAISDCADVLALKHQRTTNCISTIPLIAKNHEHSVFYQVDLEQLADVYVTNHLPLPPALPDDAPVLKKIHDLMFRARVTTAVTGDGSDYEHSAFRLLKDSIRASCFHEGALPRLTLLHDQIIWGRSPVRIDLAGGWTDTPPYCLINGGKVVNLALNLNGQPPLQCFIKPTTTPTLVIRSIDLGVEELISSYDQLTDFNRLGSAFAITKAALSLVGFSPEFCPLSYASLQAQLTSFGGGLEITTLAAVPKGSGLGTSSILAATVLGTLAESCDLNWDIAKISQMTLVLEQLLTTGGGWQDQFGGITQGMKLIETKPGFDQVPVMRWLPSRLFNDVDHKSSMLLYYTGITRVARNILAEIVRGMFLNSGKQLGLLEEIGANASDTFEVIQRGHYHQLGRHVEKSWDLNTQLDAGTSTPEIDHMLKSISPYLIGKKLCGAGGGGFMFMMASDLDAAKEIRKILNATPLNPNARFVDFQLSDTGLQITRS